jgi:hypothetical protein
LAVVEVDGQSQTTRVPRLPRLVAVAFRRFADDLGVGVVGLMRLMRIRNYLF